jgi:hypothetical protein
VALTDAGETLVFRGDGKGNFTREQAGIPAYGPGCRGAHVEVRDLDGDRRAEIVASFALERPDDQPGICPSEGGITAWRLR